jgi:hypothetical protein
MRDKYNNLILAVSKFSEDLWIPYEDSIGSLNLSIKGGIINKENLIKEFEEAINNSNFEWRQLAKESELFIDVNSHTNEELKEHVENLLTFYLYPELELSTEQEISLEQAIVFILKNKSRGGQEWVSLAELLSTISAKPEFSNIGSYHIWDLFLKKILYNKLPIERKPFDRKERYIGYLRYKDSQG